MTGQHGRPYASLEPVVALLEECGNFPVDGGFLNSPGGWYCRMRDRLDIALIRSSLEVPASWVLSADGDTVLDRNTWCAVLGPAADGYG